VMSCSAGRDRRRLRPDRTPARRIPHDDHRIRDHRHGPGSRRRTSHPGGDVTPGRMLGDGVARPLRGLDHPSSPSPRIRPDWRSLM